MEGQKVILSPYTLDEITARFEAVIDSKLSQLKDQFTSTGEKPKYGTRTEVAEELKISLPTLHELTKSGKLKAYRIGSRVLYRWDEVEESLNEIQSAKFKRN